MKEKVVVDMQYSYHNTLSNLVYELKAHLEHAEAR